MDARLELGILGPVQAVVDHRDHAPSGERPRRLLALLVLHGGRVASDDALCDALWPDELPADHRAALQTQVYRLRRALPLPCIVRSGGGYRLDAGPASIDAVRFESAVHAAVARRAHDPLGALQELEGAIARWRGRPYEELGDVVDATIEAQRLEEVLRLATEERFECLLLAGRHHSALADLDAFASLHPERERPQLQLMQVLHRVGRLGDALGVYDRHRRCLAEQLGIDPSPRITALHDEIIVGSPADEDLHPRRRPAAMLTGRARIPRRTSTFVGRDPMLATLDELVSGHRLVTLLGTGGVGKTRLAAELALRVEARFDDGVWFCALADTAAGGVAAAVAATVGVEQRAGDDPVDRIARVLAHQRSLLVLDNCEHVLDEAAALAEAVTHHAAQVSVLATSRERLNADGEHLFPVAPLPVPEGEVRGDQPAVALFIDRARAVRPHWRPDGAAIEQVADVCRRLAGLPLAIELAAARLHTHTLDEVVAGLDGQLRLLVGGRRTVDRHRSLSAAVAWSHELLSAGQRDVFDAVAVFRAPFTAAGAVAVSGHRPDVAAERLAELVERSMLHRVGDRYGMLEPLRAFGRERLDERGRSDAARRAHAVHLREVLLASAGRLRLPEQPDVLDEVERDIPDAEMAVRTCLSSAEPELALDVIDALHQYGLHRMRHEVLGWAEAAAEVAIRTACPPDRIADAYAIAAFGAWKRGDFDRYQELTDEAQRWSRRAGVEATARTADALSTFTLVSGRLDEALHWTALAQELWTARGDRLRAVEAEGVHLLAVAYRGGDATAGADAMLRRLGDGASLLEAAFSWYTAGEVLVDRQPDVALARLRRAVHLAAACGSHFVQGIAGSTVASLEARSGDADAAIEHYRWLLPHWRRAGVHSLAWTSLRSVAELLGRTGADRPAAVLLGAVTSTATGHEVFGADADRLEALGGALRDRLGPAAFDDAVAEGSTFSDAEATGFALAAFDQR